MEVTASLIHNGHQWLPEGSSVVFNSDGQIAEIRTEASSEAQILDGIVCPGFINTHCHLELSHMAGCIPKHTGLPGFLQQVITARNNFNIEDKLDALDKAHKQLLTNGIVAVGDIANTTDTLAARNKGKLHFHTFVEAIGFSEHIAAKAMANAQSVLQEFGSQESTGNVMLRESITPHAPYSVSQQLFRSIAAAHPQLLSIHNQESAAENEYYQQKTGLFSNFLQGLGINDDYFIPSGKGSLPTYLQWLTGVERILLVHNTFSTQADVDATNIPGLQTFWCLCPNANLYIENCLPDVQLLRKLKQHICIGTDSLASNDTLDVYRELHTLHTSFPEIEWEELLKWATFNGAVALGLQQHVGQIVPGMAPGIVHIEQPYDKANYRVTVIA